MLPALGAAVERMKGNDIVFMTSKQVSLFPECNKLNEKRPGFPVTVTIERLGAMNAPKIVTSYLP